MPIDAVDTNGGNFIDLTLSDTESCNESYEEVVKKRFKTNLEKNLRSTHSSSSKDVSSAPSVVERAKIFEEEEEKQPFEEGKADSTLRYDVNIDEKSSQNLDELNFKCSSIGVGEDVVDVDKGNAVDEDMSDDDTAGYEGVVQEDNDEDMSDNDTAGYEGVVQEDDGENDDDRNDPVIAANEIDETFGEKAHVSAPTR